jgi:hypothetical protein
VADDGKSERRPGRDRREELEVLAEAEVVEGAGERNGVQVDDEPATRPPGQMRSVDGDPVGHVEHRGRDRAEPEALLDADRWAHVPPVAERRSGCAERAGDHELVAGTRAGTAGDAVGAPDRGHGHDDGARAGRIASAHGDARCGEALVQLDDALHLHGGRNGQRDEERVRPRSRGGEIADVDGSGSEAELPPGQAVEPEMDAFDESVLSDDDAVVQFGRVVLRPHDQAALLELAQQAELAEVRELHRPRRAALRSRTWHE